MFDSINLQDAICDVFDYGLNDDNLALVYKANQKVHMAVKTPGGLTERQVIEDSVLQGDTFGPLLASVQVDSIAKEVAKVDAGYKYKEELDVPILGLIDDIIGISEAGYKAQIVNTILNLKSAEKGLQFGTSKCKKMIIGKETDRVRSNKIHVDKWSEKYVENEDTGETELEETYVGKIEIEEVNEYKYLGFTLSSKGNNISNIQSIETKSIGVMRTIMKKLENMKLRQYYFECAKIFMNVILRGSILYASECYYNLTENELRRIEKIEERYIRKVFKTGRNCPIAQMYLEFGQWPARFEIQKKRCLFLKYILNQNENSQIYKFFRLQLDYPTKGDWVSRCLIDLSELKIKKTLNEIKQMPRIKFKNLIKIRIETNALEYLQNKRGSKGKEIEFTSLEMSEYLLPYNSIMSIEEKREMFALRNRMTNIPINFGNKEEKCICGSLETMSHIYSCESINQTKIKTNYEHIYNGNLRKIIEIFRRMKTNLKTRQEIKSRTVFPCDPSDPPYCISMDLG